MSTWWIATLAAAALAVGEAVALLATRARWSAVGLGMHDERTGAHSLNAVNIEFPALLEIANEADVHLVLAHLVFGPGDVDAAAAQICTHVRGNERIIRTDYDRFALLMLTKDRADAVRGAARIAAPAGEGLRIGFASAPEDGADFFDLLLRSGERLAPLSRVTAVASSLDQ